MKQSTFRAKLRNMRFAISSQSIELLKIESKRAADTLVQLLDEDNPPAVRRAAANDILNYVLKFREDEASSSPFLWSLNDDE